MINNITAKVKQLITSGETDKAVKMLLKHSPKEIAEIINPLEADIKRVLFNQLDVLLAADVMVELNEISKYEILKEIQERRFEEIIHKIHVTYEIFVSEILGKVVLDARGEEIGPLKDFVICSGELFPEVEAFIVRTKNGHMRILWNHVNIFNKRVIAILRFKEELESFTFSDNLLMLCRDLLDRQILDINGAKVVRINDLKLGEIKGKLHLLAADVGTRGLLRRLGLERLADRMHIQLSTRLVPWNFFQPLEPKFHKLTVGVTKQLLAKLHPADIAQMVIQLPEKERGVLISALPAKLSAEVVSELSPEAQSAILDQVGMERASGILHHLPPDEATDLIGDLPGEKAKRMLEIMNKEDIQDIENLLYHHDDTAGGLMTTEFFALDPEISIGTAIEKLRERAQEVETIYYVYLTEESGKLVGVLSLRDLILGHNDTKLKDIMVTQLKTVKPETYYKEVGEVLSTYNLVAVPVVNESGILLGIVTVDDILEIIFPSETIRKRSIR